jgi:hypothetical protein
MTQFPGQISRLGLQGTQAIVWQIKPYIVKVFFTMKERAYSIFKMDVR